MSDTTYTPAEYEYARRYVISDTEDPDFGGVGEMFEDEWKGLTLAEFDARMRRVHDLACSATVTVSWPHEQNDARAKTLDEAATAARQALQKMREEGETDMRSAIGVVEWAIRNLGDEQSGGKA
jgi:hypothetical protein